MTVTIRDVAKRLNLSITTVSRALDGYDDVAEGTRQRVIEAAREMGYVPSRTARQLRTRRTYAVGYLMPTSAPRFTDPFFADFIAGLGDELGLRGYDLLVSTIPPGEPERGIYQRWVRSRRTDGMVLSRMRLNDWRVQYLSEAGCPFVAFGRTLQALDFPNIEVDGQAGMQRLVAHLAGRGHKRIAYVSAPPDLALQSDRFAGYCEGLRNAGLDLDAALIAEGNLTRPGGYEAARQLLALAEPPTAIIGANDLTAIGVMRAARDLGLRIGRDLAVAGFDGIEAAEHSEPPLTTLRQPVYDIARQIVGMLITLIEGGELQPRHVVLQPELIIRESTDP